MMDFSKSKQEPKQKGHKGSKVLKTYEFPDQPDAVDELLDIIKSRDEKIEMLEKQNRKYGQVFQRSEEIHEKVAKVTESKCQFDNVNDSFENNNITETFNKLYDFDWLKLMMWLGRTFPDIQEIEFIQTITELLKNGYKKCCLLADAQIRDFLMLDETRCTLDYENNLELYTLRKQYMQSESARAKVEQIVSGKLLLGEVRISFCTDENREDTKQNLKTFLHKYVECCWLMVIATPPLSLNFDVVGKPYCREHFRMYSHKKPVEDETKENGTVYEVVWPSISLKDGSVLYKKGDVIVVSKGSQREERHENVECSCSRLECNDYLEKSFGRTNKETIEGFEKKPSGKRMLKNTGRDKPSKQSNI